MHIKTKRLPYEKVLALPTPKNKKPIRASRLLQAVIRFISIPGLSKVRFTYSFPDKEKIKGKPCLILMNHSCFLDMMIANRVLYPKRYNIVSTTDAFVGLAPIMRWLGCIPTTKFVPDLRLLKNIKYMLKAKNTSVLMYPEAGYSFDGRATALPDTLGALVKSLGVPVVFVKTEGAFIHNPLYNELQKRKVKVSATASVLFTEEQLKEHTAEALDAAIKQAFSFDSFRWQYDNKVEVAESFRADGLERILYKCAACGAEGKTCGKGTALVCNACGKRYELDTYGRLQAVEGETEFAHIPDWFEWQRSCVRTEIESGTYSLECPVDIGMLVNSKAVYMVGNGKLTHGADGFTLTGCDGKLSYTQPPLASYSLNADYYWYEMGDIISIGTAKCLYYCFPPKGTPVAKARLATEELYKMHRRGKRIK